MNMLDLPRPACPYCEHPLAYWGSPLPISQCHTCQRPVGRYPAARRPTIYRLVSLVSVAKGLTALLGALLLFSFLVLRAPLGALAAVVAFQLALFGSIDITDGILGLTTKIDRTARRVRAGADARRPAVGKILFGALNCIVGVVGFLAVKGLG